MLGQLGLALGSIAVAIIVRYLLTPWLGTAFPLGMKLAASRAGSLTPWLWGMNGAASVFASVLSVCIALTWSISAAYWTGCVCYVIAFVAFRLQGRVAPLGV